MLQTQKKIHPEMLRELMRPLFPAGHSIDGQLMFNFRLKCKKILASKPGNDVGAITLTSEDEQYKLEKPDANAKEQIKALMVDDIPPGTHHVVLLGCYLCAKQNQAPNLNLVKLAVLGEGGQELPQAIAYVPIYKVQNWLNTNCVRRQRSKHVMSSLMKENPSNTFQENDLYEYSPYWCCIFRNN
jgi:hypothetical protein